MPRFAPSRCHGFTLLELMVVLVLMGIILSMTTLTVGDGGPYRRMEEEANRLMTLMSMAKEEAILRSQEWAVVFKEDGYLFELQEVEMVNGTPQVKRTPIENKIFRGRELQGYRLSVVIEDSEFAVSREDGEEDVLARIHILSSGEMTEFELTIRQEEIDDHFILKATPFGELSLTGSRDDEA